MPAKTNDGPIVYPIEVIEGLAAGENSVFIRFFAINKISKDVSIDAEQTFLENSRLLDVDYGLAEVGN